MNHSNNESIRGNNGRFAPGQSGNPGGRPRAENAALRLWMEKDVESVAQVIISRALAGDMVAARMVIDRFVPSLKSVSAPVSVELPREPGTFPIAESIMRAALAGSISPETAAQLVSVANQLCRIAEVEEFKQRLEALERATGCRGKSPKS